MRTYDVPYVPNPNKALYPNPPLDSLSLQEITKQYLCGKSEHKLSNCRKCTEKCIYGIRALELFFGAENRKPEENKEEAMTILERFRRAKEAEKKKPEMSVTKNGHKFIKDWYKQAEASGNIVEWVMENFDLSREKALSKIYNYRYCLNKKQKNNEIVEMVTKSADPVEKPDETSQKPAEEVKPEPAEKKPAEKVEKKPEEPAEKQENPIEEKLAYFMRLQDEYKKKIEEYQKLYDEAKRKGDILCNAMDIMNG